MHKLFLFLSILFLLSCQPKHEFEGKWINAIFDMPIHDSYPKSDEECYLESTIEFNGSTIHTSMMEKDLEGPTYRKESFEIIETKDTCGIKFFILKSKDHNELNLLPALPISKDKIRFESFFIRSKEATTIEKIEEYILIMTEKYTTFPFHGEIYRTEKSYEKLKKLPMLKFPLNENGYLDFLNESNNYLLKHSDLIHKGFFIANIPAHQEEIKQEVLIEHKFNPYTSMFTINQARENLFNEDIKQARFRFYRTFDSIYFINHPRMPGMRK